MDATTSGTPALQYHNLPEQPVSTASPPLSPFQRQKRHCFGDSTPGDFPLAASPSIVLHVLTECRLDPRDLANLEVPCRQNAVLKFQELIALPLILVVFFLLFLGNMLVLQPASKLCP